MAISWHVQLFGGLRVQIEQRTLPHFPTQRAGLLLARLATHPKRLLTREELGEWLWPEVDPELQHARLRGEVLTVRKALGKEALVSQGKLRLGISEDVSCDVALFQKHLLAALQTRTSEERLPHLEAALSLYRGEFLPGSYDSWAITERERLKTAHYDILRRFYLDSLQLGLCEQAEQAGKALQLQSPDDPLPVVPLRVQPSPSSPSLCGAPEYRKPPQTERIFIGREPEQRLLHAWSRNDGKRLLTLTGMGGIGKTRLIQEFAHTTDLPVYFVPLADLRDHTYLENTILDSLGLNPNPNTTAPMRRQQLTAYLKGLGKSVLILDNVEQIIDPIATLVVDLLHACPSLRILASSRCLLEIEMERELALEPLSEKEASALFVDRARAQRPDFLRTPQDQYVVNEICHVLEGIPLSVELAAARAFVLGPRELQAQLIDRWTLLVSRRRDLPARQRSLWATLEWSLELLPTETRLFFERLSVFAVPCSLEAASILCTESALLHLEILRSHSLLSLFSQPDDPIRYGLLATLRDFASRRLPQEDPAFSWHATYFANKASDWLHALRTPQESNALRAFVASVPEIQAALRWASHHNPLLAARLGLALGALHLRSGALLEAIAPLHQAQQSALPQTTLWASILCESAGLELDRQKPDAARNLAHTAYEWASRNGESLQEADALHLLGQAAMQERSIDLAQRLFDQAAHLYEALNEPARAARVYNNQGILHYPTPNSREYLECALRLYRDAGDLRGIAAALNNLGALAQERQDLEFAEMCYRESLQIEATLGNVFGVARSANNLGEVAQSQGALQSATQRFLLAQQLFKQLGHPFEQTATSALQTLPDLPAIRPLSTINSSQLPHLILTLFEKPHP